MIVSVDWLSKNLDRSNLLVLDASLGATVAKLNGVEIPEGYGIPGSRTFDLDQKFSDLAAHFPHTLPSSKQFEAEAKALGISNDNLIVIYDRNGIYSSPRAWWMFKAMGLDQVYVLDGGLPAWIQAGYEIAKKAESFVAGTFQSKPRTGYFCDSIDVLKWMKEESAIFLDARTEGRFRGVEPEPRAGVRSGHIPGAYNIPFAQVLIEGKIKSKEELTSIFDMKIRSGQRVVLSCGSGVTACILALAASIAGYLSISVYDGSWSEWGSSDELPIENESIS